MAEGSGFDLNYITERIIGVTFPPSCPDQTYHHNLQSVTQMLLSKHSDRYMVINLSEHSDDLSRLNRKVLDLGWQEQHAPSLHLLCSVCKNMDVWLNTHPDHVLLLHCRGSKDRVGVVISSYILLSTVSSREEQALDLYSMKKFCYDGLVKLMTPSQKRYVQVFGRLINHQIHINSSPLFIHHISIQPIPVVQSTVCQLFIRIYQGSQTIHTTEVSQVFVGQTDRLSFLLNPPQMTRDPRFPKDGVVEVLFSEIIDMDFSLTAANSQWKSVAAVDSLQAQWNFTQNVKRGQSNEGTRSLSSDSGLSSSSLWTGGQTSGFLMNYSSEDNPHLHRVISGFRMEEEQLSFGLSILDPAAVIQTKFDGSVHLNGEAGLSIERETDIIDDDDDSLLHDHASAAFLEHNNRLSLQEMSSLSSVEQRSQTSVPSDDCHDGASSVNSSLKSVPLDLQPQIWVKQSPTLYTSPSSDVLEDRQKMEEQRLFSKNSVTDNGFSESEKDDEFATLALDIDQSIEQLNQLILDLDPEFEPIPTQARSHMPRSASLHTNGKIHSEEKTPITGWKRKQLSDVSEYSVLRHTGFDPIQNIQSFSAGTPSPRGLYHSDSVDVCDFAPDTDSQMWAVLDKVPPTPAFPVSPPTPYVKSGHDFFPPRHISQTNRHYMGSSLLQESRGYVDSMTHASVPSDGELFHSDVTGNTVSCQRMFGSMRSVSTPSSLVSPDSPTQAHSWLEGGSSTPLSLYTPQPSPPLLLSAPNSHSSPRRPPRSLSSSLDVTGLESSLLEAVEGLEALGLDVAQPPLLPLKRRGTEGSETMLSFPLNRTGFSTSFTSHNSSPTRSTPSPDFMGGKPETVKFVQDTSKFWYKPDISREQAITILKDKEPGSFIIRDSHSFRGAYGLAMKVATPPPSVLHQSRKSGDLSNELVRHFLIECTQKGVRLKGCPNEPYFGSLTALVCQHSITPLALPCRLIIPDKDPLEDLSESQTQTSTNSAAELLKQGAACNVWFLGSVDLESLTGVHGVQKATTVIFSLDPPTTSTVVHFKVSSQGITLTDNQRKLFFRRHYAVNTVIFCALDPQDRKWTRDGCTSAKIFGFIARKSGSSTENVCHLFAEHDPEQPASAIVNFVSKVMIGSLKTK